eukprot:XP_013965834.1 collagen alpha-1(I) chain-like [Canis lupus familiaris]
MATARMRLRAPGRPPGLRPRGSRAPPAARGPRWRSGPEAWGVPRPRRPPAGAPGPDEDRRGRRPGREPGDWGSLRGPAGSAGSEGAGAKGASRRAARQGGLPGGGGFLEEEAPGPAPAISPLPHPRAAQRGAAGTRRYLDVQPRGGRRWGPVRPEEPGWQVWEPPPPGAAGADGRGRRAEAAAPAPPERPSEAGLGDQPSRPYRARVGAQEGGRKEGAWVPGRRPQEGVIQQKGRPPREARKLLPPVRGGDPKGPDLCPWHPLPRGRAPRARGLLTPCVAFQASPESFQAEHD